MRNIFVLVFFYILSINFLSAQADDSWEYFLSIKDLKYQRTYGDTIQFSCEGGNLKVNRNTFQAKWLEKHSSGLTHQAVHDYAIDQDGVEWFVTRYKISSFDGETWTEYNESNSQLPSNYNINGVYVLPDNTKVFSTYWGLTIYDGENWETTFVAYENQFYAMSNNGIIIFGDGSDFYALQNLEIVPLEAVNDAFSFSEDIQVISAENGDIFFSGPGDLVVLSNGEFYTYDAQNSVLESGYMVEIAVDNQSRLWLNTSTQSYHYYEGTFTEIPYIPGTSITPLDENQALFVNTFNEVELYDNGSITPLAAPLNSPHGTRILHVDENNGIWIEAVDKGLYYYTNDEWIEISIPGPKFAFRFIFDLALDINGNPWFTDLFGNIYGYQNGEPYTYHHSQFENLSDYLGPHITRWGSKMAVILGRKLVIFNNGEIEIKDCFTDVALCGTYLSQIAADDAGNLWITKSINNAGQFLVKYDGITWQTEPIPLNFASSVAGITPIGEDELYLSTYNSGYIHYSQGTMSQFTTANSGVPSDNIYKILQAENGTLWFGTGDGLVKMEGDEWITYEVPAELGPDNVTNHEIVDFDLENDGTLWLAVPHLGLISFNDSTNTWRSWTHDNSGIIDNMIRIVEVDQNGVKYIGTEWCAASLLEGDSELGTVANPNRTTENLIYPNPTMDIFQISNLDTTVYNLEILDVHGKVLKAWGGNSSQYDISALSKGIYIVRWKNSEGTKTQVLMKY